MKLLLSCLPLTLLALAVPASATIVYSDAGSAPLPQTIGYGGYGVVGTVWDYSHTTSDDLASEFSLSVNAKLTQIDVYLEVDPNASGRVTFGIYSDNGGSPGTQIGASFIGTVSSGNSTLVKIPVSGVSVTAGQEYWLVATPTDTNTYVNWVNNPSDTGLHAMGFTVGGSTSWDVEPSYYGSNAYFAIEGTTVAPEPGNLWLGVLGLAAVAMRGVRSAMRG